MSALAADGGLLRAVDANPFNATGNAQLIARLERLPVTRRLMCCAYRGHRDVLRRLHGAGTASRCQLVSGVEAHAD